MKRTLLTLLALASVAFAQTKSVSPSGGGLNPTDNPAFRTALGGTTIGQSMFTLSNPSAITFPRINANNTLSALTASDFRTAVGALENTSVAILEKLNAPEVETPARIGTEFMPDALSGVGNPVPPIIVVNGTQGLDGNYAEFGKHEGRSAYTNGYIQLRWQTDRWQFVPLSGPLGGTIYAITDVAVPQLGMNWVRTGTEDIGGGPYTEPLFFPNPGPSEQVRVASYLGQLYFNYLYDSWYRWNGWTWQEDPVTSSWNNLVDIPATIVYREGVTGTITARPAGVIGPSITLAASPSAGFLQYVTPQGGNILFKAAYLDDTVTNEYIFPDKSGTVALEQNTGKTIFVDSGTGNDTRGTTSKYSVSTPFATISAAIAASAIGDTVRVRAGTYPITSTISLNNEGNLHLEEGTVVTCSVDNAPVFTLSLNQAKVISGGGQFVIAGTTTKFWEQSGGSTAQNCSIECYSIVTSSNNASIFDVSTGVLVVQAGTVYAPTSTIAYCPGTISNVNYRVPFTYCAMMVDMPTSGSQAQFSCDTQTIQCFGTKCFRVVGGTLGIDYQTLVDATSACTFFSFEYGDDSVVNTTTIRGGRAITYSNNPCINFSTMTGTNKGLRFYGDPFFFTNGTYSITAESARTVLSSSASSNKSVEAADITITGNFLVNAAFDY